MFEFAWPWIFLLAPLPWLLRMWLPPADSGEAALQVSFLGELENLSGRRARLQLPPWRKQVYFALLWLLLLSATARPEWVGEPLPLPASGRDLLIAVDVSGSMDYADMRWEDEEVSRLVLVKHLMGDFIEGRTGDRLGLILFGSQAYLQAPLTFDRQTVRTWLDEAVIGIAGKNTAIGDAIGLAVKRLRQRPAHSRVLVLITDGANNGGEIEPMIAARLAAEEGVTIYPSGLAPTRSRAATSRRSASIPAWIWTSRPCARLPNSPAASTSAPAIRTNCRPSKRPSTASSRWPSNRPWRALPWRSTHGPWLRPWCSAWHW